MDANTLAGSDFKGRYNQHGRDFLKNQKKNPGSFVKA